MQIYLVGGAVRDQLLGLDVHERDWLVTEGDHDALLAAGFAQVGKDFPVYLHPQTHEEHALPRGGGTGLEGLLEDLRRRDLTINALAQGPDDQLIDPCGGYADLQQGRLRPTAYFFDDPIRILRLARFAARFHGLGFKVVPEAIETIAQRVSEGILDELVAERVFQEIDKAMGTPRPDIFIQTLRQCGALSKILPEVDRLFGVPQTARHHPEIDTGVHSLMVLQQASRVDSPAEVRFAALLHDIGKGTTDKAEWPSHRGHEQRGADMIGPLAERLRLPKPWRDLAELSARYHLQGHRALELRPQTLLALFQHLDVWRRPDRLEQFIAVCEADARGRLGFEDQPYPQADYLRQTCRAAASVDCAEIARQVDQPAKIAPSIRRARLAAIQKKTTELRATVGVQREPSH